MKSILPRSCSNCIIRKNCGGHDLPLIRAVGCVSLLDPSSYRADHNDMNPRNPEDFWKKWMDVGGLLDLRVKGKVIGPDSSDFPKYIVKLHDSSSRHRPLDSQPWIGIPLRKLLFTRRKEDIGLKFSSREEICEAFKFSPVSKIIAIGSDHDPYIERFWETHQSHNLPAILKQLGIDAVTSPNYSLFTDITGFQTVRNLKRILLVAKRLSDAGLATIVHINAFRDQHWAFWRTLLRQHPEISVVAKEFETGAGEAEIIALSQLQEDLNRDLHPILIGGGRFYKLAKTLFSSFTILDSRPFQSAIHREALVREDDSFRLVKAHTKPGEFIDNLLAQNVRIYPDYLERSEPEDAYDRPGPKGQLEFKL